MGHIPAYALGGVPAAEDGGLSNEGQGGDREKVAIQPLQQSGFPSTSVLDTFNRADGAIGSNWSGYTTAYAIASNQLDVVASDWDNHIYWKNSDAPFGADQEAFVTLSQLDHDEGSEQQLILKSQSNTSYGNGVLIVLYDSYNDIVQVVTYDLTNGWVQHGANISVTFNNGDQFGARAKSNGDVEVYKNGSLLVTRSVTSWEFYDDGGYIGLWFANATDAVLDNFGGGTIQGGQGFSQRGGKVQYRIANDEKDPDPFDVELTNAEIFWQGISLGSELTTKVSFTQLDKTSIRQKPQSNGMWGEDIIQIMYDVPNNRIQVWKFEGKAWIQVGKDIPIQFVDGDVFTVFAGKDGTVEIYRDEKLLSTRQPHPCSGVDPVRCRKC